MYYMYVILVITCRSDRVCRCIPGIPCGSATAPHAGPSALGWLKRQQPIFHSNAELQMIKFISLKKDDKIYRKRQTTNIIVSLV
jgi:hypothetical protein